MGASTDNSERAQLEDAGYDTTRIVARRGHHCLYARRGEKCPGTPGCETSADERDGFVCTACGAWAETILGLLHRDAACVPSVRPPRRRKRS